MLGGAYLGGSTVDLYQLKGNIDQVLHPQSCICRDTSLNSRLLYAKDHSALPILAGNLVLECYLGMLTRFCSEVCAVSCC